jgi:hypothetical protein
MLVAQFIINRCESLLPRCRMSRKPSSYEPILAQPISSADVAGAVGGE